MSLFGAAWTLGSLKYLCEAGVAGITYYETVGWRGVMEDADGSLLPDRFRSIPAGAFPLFHVFANLGEYKGGEVLRSESSAPLLVDGIVLCRGDRFCALLSNMRREPRLVTLRANTDVAQLSSIYATNAEAAMREPESFRCEFVQDVRFTDGRLELTLAPYALARVAGVLS
jgi:hypothetical protein